MYISSPSRPRRDAEQLQVHGEHRVGRDLLHLLVAVGVLGRHQQAPELSGAHALDALVECLDEGSAGGTRGCAHLEAVGHAAGHARALPRGGYRDSAKLDVEVDRHSLPGPGAALGGSAALDVVVHDGGISAG